MNWRRETVLLSSSGMQELRIRNIIAQAQEPLEHEFYENFTGPSQSLHTACVHYDGDTLNPEPQRFTIELRG